MYYMASIPPSTFVFIIVGSLTNIENYVMMESIIKQTYGIPPARGTAAVHNAHTREHGFTRLIDN